MDLLAILRCLSNPRPGKPWWRSRYEAGAMLQQ